LEISSVFFLSPAVTDVVVVVVVVVIAVIVVVAVVIVNLYKCII
jgi:hypothetical protein